MNTQRARSGKPDGSCSSGRSESGDNIDPDVAVALGATLGTRRPNARLRSRRIEKDRERHGEWPRRGRAGGRESASGCGGCDRLAYDTPKEHYKEVGVLVLSMRPKNCLQ